MTPTYLALTIYILHVAVIPLTFVLLQSSVQMMPLQPQRRFKAEDAEALTCNRRVFDSTQKAFLAGYEYEYFLNNFLTKELSLIEKQVRTTVQVIVQTKIIKNNNSKVHKQGLQMYTENLIHRIDSYINKIYPLFDMVHKIIMGKFTSFIAN